MLLKRIGIVFLLFTFAISSIEIGTILFVKKRLVQMEVKSELHKGMHKKKLVELEIYKGPDATQIHWEKPHEFEYRGNKYDVVNKTELNDRFVYLCYHDRKETKIDQKFKKESQKKQNPENQFSKLLKAPLFISDHSLVFVLFFEKEPNLKSFLARLINNYTPSVFSPPDLV